VAVMFMPETLFELGLMFSNRGNGGAHELPSKPRP
jgi:hypothetical protein